METPQKSIFYRAYDPFLQVGFVLTLILIVTLGAKLVNWLGISEIEQLFPWTVSTAFILFFAMFNSIFSLSTKDTNKYWTRSMIGFMGLAVGSALLAWLVSGVSIGDARSYKWIYIVLTFGYLVFLSMVSFMRKVVDFAQREEWNRPRPRRK